MVIKILAFNTVTELCSVALMIDQSIYDHSVVAPRCRAEKILPMIHKLLVDTGVSLKSLDCIVFDQGPGSFMGMRVGISIAQGLALGANLPLASVSSLMVLAQGAERLFSAKNVITTLDASMKKLYWARFSRNLDNTVWICKENACVLNEVIAYKIINRLIGKWVIIGTGWKNYESFGVFIEKRESIIFQKIMLPAARDMLLLGLDSWEKKKLFTPDQIQPMYLSYDII